MSSGMRGDLLLPHGSQICQSFGVVFAVQVAVPGRSSCCGTSQVAERAALARCWVCSSWLVALVPGRSRLGLVFCRSFRSHVDDNNLSINIGEQCNHPTQDQMPRDGHREGPTMCYLIYCGTLSLITGREGPLSICIKSRVARMVV